MNILTLKLPAGIEFIVHVDNNLKVTHIDKSLTQITNQPVDHFVGRDLFESILDGVELENEVFAESLVNGEAISEIISNGESNSIRLKCSPMYDTKGEFSGSVVTCTTGNGTNGLNVTDEEIQRTMYHEYPDAVGIIDPETLVVLECNEAAYQKIGLTREQFVGQPLTQFDFHRNPEKVKEQFKRVQEAGFGEIDVESITTWGDKKNLHLHLSMVNLAGRQVMRVITRDTTDQNRAEEELKKSELQYRSLVEASPDIVMQIDLAGTILYVNRVLKGTRNEDAIGTNFLDYLPVSEHKRVRKLLNRSLSKRRNTEFEVSVVTPVGTRWWNTRALPQEKDGTVNRFLLITTDATNTKRAQDGLKLSEERYRSLVEKSPLPIIVHQYGFFKFANPVAMRLLGLTASDGIEGKHIRDYIHPADRERVNREFPTTYVLDEPTRTSEFRIQKPTGEVRDVHTTAIVINYEGQLSRMLMLEDVTETKRAQDALTASEERYRKLVEQSPLPIFVHHDGAFIFTNLEGCKLMGVESAEEIIGSHIINYVHEDDVEYLKTVLSPATNVDSGPRNIEFKLKRPDGEIREIVTSSMVLEFDGVEARVFVVHDVTEFNKALHNLKSSEERYRNLTEYSPLPIFVHRHGQFVYLNKKLVDLLQLESAEEAIGKSVFDFVWKDDKERLIAELPKTYSIGDDVSNFKFKIRRKDGELRDILASVITVDYSGELLRMAQLTDVTKQNQILSELTHSEERYRTLVENAPIPTIVTIDGELVYANPAGVAMTGVTKLEELIGDNVIEYVHPDDQPRIAEVIKEHQGSESKISEVEFRYQRIDGQILDLTGTSINVTYEGKKAILAMFQDVTERKKALDALSASEQKFRFLTENMRDAVFHMDMNFIHHYISPTIEQIRGFTVDDIMVLPIQDSLPPKSLENAQKLLAYSIERGGYDEDGNPLKFMFEQEEYTKDGGKVWTEVSAGFVYDDDENPVGIIGCTRDISERKEREKLLRKQQDSLKQIVELNPYPMVILDKDGFRESYNNAFRELYASIPDESYNFFEDPMIKGLGLSEELKRAKDGEVVEFPEIEYNPKYVDPVAPDITVYIRVTCFPVRNEDGEVENYVFMYNDVTESRMAEAEARTAEEKYKYVVENIPMFVVMYYGNELTYMNKSALEFFFDDTSYDISKLGLLELMHDDGEGLGKKKVEFAQSNPEKVQHSVLRVKAHDGIKWIEGTGITIDSSGTPTRILMFKETEPRNEGPS